MSNIDTRVMQASPKSGPIAVCVTHYRTLMHRRVNSTLMVFLRALPACRTNVQGLRSARAYELLRRPVCVVFSQTGCGLGTHTTTAASVNPSADNQSTARGAGRDRESEARRERDAADHSQARKGLSGS